MTKNLKQHLYSGSPYKLYQTLQGHNFITEQKAPVNDINIIVLTSKRDEESNTSLFRTAKKIKDICDKRGIPNYIVFAETSYIVRQDDGSHTIHNIDDEKGFEIDSDKTISIIRGSTAKSSATKDLISQLERASIFCVNSRSCMEICGDKYRTVLALSGSGIPTPKTALVQNIDGLEYAFETIGGKFPVILKTLSGSKGIGIFYAESWKSLRSVLQVIWKINDEEEILVQQFIESSYDVRVHVLGGEVIASMKRYVMKDDFRSNYSLGGKVGKIKITEDQKDICVRSAKIVGATWAGVDFIEDKKGNVFVLEVNSSPGTEGIEKATGKNVTNQIVDYVIDSHNWIKVAQECGFREVVEIKGMGQKIAKFDTGNGSFCVLHTDSFVIDKDKKIVSWVTDGNTDGKKMSKEYSEIKDVRVGGLRDYTEERPLIELDVVFDGVLYTGIKFTLDDRTNRTPVLLNRSFMRKAHVSVNPARVFVITNKPEEEGEKK